MSRKPTMKKTKEIKEQEMLVESNNPKLLQSHQLKVKVEQLQTKEITLKVLLLKMQEMSSISKLQTMIELRLKRNGQVTVTMNNQLEEVEVVKALEEVEEEIEEEEVEEEEMDKPSDMETEMLKLPELMEKVTNTPMTPDQEEEEMPEEESMKVSIKKTELEEPIEVEEKEKIEVLPMEVMNL